MRERIPLREIFLAAFLILCLALVVPTLAQTQANTKKQPQFDNQLYSSLMSQQLDSLDDMVAQYEYQQVEFVPVLPPGPECSLQQDAGIYAFDPAGFPADFVKRLVPDYSLSVATYPVRIYEDPKTRNRIIVNSAGNTLASIPPPADYEADWFMLEAYPLLNSGKYSPDAVAFTEANFDPSRLVVGIRLIAKQDVEKYVSVVSLKTAAASQADSLALVTKGGGITPMMMYTGAPVSHLQFTCIERTNDAVKVTIAYPASYTNKIEIFTCNDLVPGWFYSAGTTNINRSTNWIEWTDAAGAWTNFTPRFYAAGNADLDSDGDGLTDAQEKYVYHTSATTNDTDHDGIPDGVEVANRTDPNNNDTNKPIITITYPTNNFVWEWLP